jgi:hypothetical protein
VVIILSSNSYGSLVINNDKKNWRRKITVSLCISFDYSKIQSHLDSPPNFSTHAEWEQLLLYYYSMEEHTFKWKDSELLSHLSVFFTVC